jgi:hypothetical protein
MILLWVIIFFAMCNCIYVHDGCERWICVALVFCRCNIFPYSFLLFLLFFIFLFYLYRFYISLLYSSFFPFLLLFFNFFPLHLCGLHYMPNHGFFAFCVAWPRHCPVSLPLIWLRGEVSFSPKIAQSKEIGKEVSIATFCVHKWFQQRSRSAGIISRLKNTVGWFFVRAKYCFGWKNKLNKTDYKPDEQG